MRHFKYIFAITLWLFIIPFPFDLKAQDHLKAPRVHWTEVKIYLSEEQKAHPDAVVKAEWVLKHRKSISSVDDLSRSQQKRIKKRAARFNCNLVFIRSIPSINYKGLFYVMYREG